jgi:hypothetical protein
LLWNGISRIVFPISIEAAASQGGISATTITPLVEVTRMVRLLSVLVLGLAVCVFTAPAAAAEGKEVKLEGTITCGKCDLKESEKCATTIVVEKDGKKTTYWFDEKSSKKYHGDICTKPTKGMVEGTCKKEGDKLILTVTKLNFAK